MPASVPHKAGALIAYGFCIAAVWGLLGPDSHAPTGVLLMAVGLQLLVGVALVFRDRWDHQTWAGIAGVVAFLTSVALLREAAGPQVGVYGLLLVLTVVWAALRGRRWEMAVALIGLAGFVTAMVESGQRYPPMTWRAGALLVVVATLLGVCVLLLVERLRASERERALLIRQLAQLARTDALTGLLNRRGWDELVPRELAHAARHGEPVTIALLDLDHFKAYNDDHGHQAGDEVLRSIGLQWTQVVRRTDLLCRWGGEEFALLMPGCGLAEAGALVQRLRDLLPAGQTCSAGLASWDGTAELEELISAADAALYDAKRAGRDRVVTA